MSPEEFEKFPISFEEKKEKEELKEKIEEFKIEKFEIEERPSLLREIEEEVKKWRENPNRNYTLEGARMERGEVPIKIEKLNGLYKFIEEDNRNVEKKVAVKSFYLTGRGYIVEKLLLGKPKGALNEVYTERDINHMIFLAQRNLPHKEQVNYDYKKDVFNREKNESIGALAEVGIIGLFKKIFGKDFLIYGSAVCDDREYKANVDFIMLDPETGYSFGFDVTTNPEEAEKKKQECYEKNSKYGGGEAKVGLGVIQTTEGKKIITSPVEKFPCYYIFIPEGDLVSLINDNIPSYNEFSEIEKAMGVNLLKKIETQLNYPCRYEETIKEHKKLLSEFKNRLEKIK